MGFASVGGLNHNSFTAEHPRISTKFIISDGRGNVNRMNIQKNQARICAIMPKEIGDPWIFAVRMAPAGRKGKFRRKISSFLL
jgi:hypothetical protein